MVVALRLDPEEDPIISNANPETIVSVGMNDIAMSTLMGFEHETIPLLKSTAAYSKNDKTELYWDGQKIDLVSLEKYAVNTQPPPGWVKYLK